MVHKGTNQRFSCSIFPSANSKFTDRREQKHAGKVFSWRWSVLFEGHEEDAYGSKAAATILPSSFNILKVDAAFLWEQKWNTN